MRAEVERVREALETIVRFAGRAVGVSGDLDVLEAATLLKREFDALTTQIENIERERNALEECDCLPVHISSAACPKCGRRGVAYAGIPHPLEACLETVTRDRDDLVATRHQVIDRAVAAEQVALRPSEDTE